MKIEKRWMEFGLPCVVIMDYTMGYRCGYVGIPKDHALYGLDYGDHSKVLTDKLGWLKNSLLVNVELYRYLPGIKRPYHLVCTLMCMAVLHIQAVVKTVIIRLGLATGGLVLIVVIAMINLTPVAWLLR